MLLIIIIIKLPRYVSVAGVLGLGPGLLPDDDADHAGRRPRVAAESAEEVAVADR